MVSIALNILWFLIGLIILAGIMWLAIWVIESFVTPIPDKLKQGIWVIILLLALIAFITALAGGGGNPFRHLGTERGPSVAAIPTEATGYL